MVLPVAFELDAGAAQVTSVDHRSSGAIEQSIGMLRLTRPDRPWFAMAGAAVMVGLVLWILAELAALCRSVRDGQPFAARNRMTLTDLASRVGLTLANLSILKTNKARAIRFSTLDALCRELKCQPGDLLAWTAEEDPRGRS
jgi:putative transcriptional regulator